jgi:hypothetical protein
MLNVDGSTKFVSDRNIIHGTTIINDVNQIDHDHSITRSRNSILLAA